LTFAFVIGSSCLSYLASIIAMRLIGEMFWNYLLIFFSTAYISTLAGGVGGGGGKNLSL
jgi:hypothetical protein